MPAPQAGRPRYPIDVFLDDAERFFAQQRYVQCVASLGTALEMTMAACAASVLLHKPAEGGKPSPAEIRMLRKRYLNNVAGLSCRSLRNLVLHLGVRQMRPQTIPEALQALELTRNYTEVLPTPEHFAAVADANIRTAVERLRDCTMIDVRQDVMHQAHVPSRREAERLRDEVGLLAVQLLAGFGVASADQVR